MKTILTALRDEDKVVEEDKRTIARALGGSTIASAISPAEESESDIDPSVLDTNPDEDDKLS